MRTLWTVVAFMAVVNLLAVGGAVGWLAGTDRLDLERVQAIRDLLAPTLSEVAAESASAAAAASDEADAASIAARRADPPLSPGAMLARAERAEDAAAQARDQVRQEVRERRAELLAERATLDRDQAEFEALRQAWARERATEAAARTDEQFTKTVTLMAGMKPRNAKQQLVAMDARGDRDVAVRILDALPVRNAVKILAEFKTPEDAILASDLLSRLRALGRDLPGPAGLAETADVDPDLPRLAGARSGDDERLDGPADR